jgi:hypothetical protein
MTSSKVNTPASFSSAAAEAARRAAEAARKAAEEAARRAMEEAARMAAEAARLAQATRGTTRPPVRDAFTATSTGQGSAPATSASAPPPSTLLGEDIRDGQANCLDRVGDWLALAPPPLRGRAEVLLLRDTRLGAEGSTGHAVIRQGNGIFDPATGRSYPSFEAFNAQGHYQIAHTVGGLAMHRILSTPAGSPERQAALDAARIPASVQRMLLADSTQPVSASSLTEVTAELEAALAASPPDPVLIAQLVNASHGALTTADDQLANLPSDLAGGTATEVAAAAAELEEVLEQVAARTDLPSELRTTAGQGALEARARVESAEAIAAMSAYVNAPTEANFDTYVREFAEAQVANQLADVQRGAAALELATPEDIAALGVAAAEIEALRAFIAPNPYQALDESLSALSSAPNADGIARQFGMTPPITSEQVLALPAEQRRQFADLLVSAQATLVTSPPPQGQPGPRNGTAETYGPQLTASLDVIAQLERSGLTWEQASQQAGQRIAELYQANPLLGVVDTGELAARVHPGMTARVELSSTGLSTSISLGAAQYAPMASEASRAALLQQITSQPGFSGTMAGIQSWGGAALDSAAQGLQTLQGNLENADPPPTARDLMPTASLAFEALLSRLGNPGEAQGANGQPGPLGAAILSASELFGRYAQEEQSQARLDLVVGLGGAAASIAAGVLTVATGGAASPLLIAALASTGLAAGGYGMYRSHENYVNAERLSQFGELSGVENPNELMYALEQGLNLLGIVFDAADLARAASVLRGADAAVSAGRTGDMLTSLDSLLASPLGMRLAGRLGEGQALTQETLQALQQLREGQYTFAQLVDIANRSVNAPQSLTATERALNDIIRAERLYTPQALDLFQRYQLTQGISPEDAYRQALAAAGNDASAVPRQLAQDFVSWISRPSTVDSARAIVMSLQVPPATAAQARELRQAWNIPASIPDATVQAFLDGLPAGLRYDFDFINNRHVLRDMPELAAFLTRSGVCTQVAPVMASVLDGGREVARTFGTGDVWFGAQKLATNGRHHYALDAAGNVWDPIAGVWGTLSEADYLRQIRTS